MKALEKILSWFVVKRWYISYSHSSGNSNFGFGYVESKGPNKMKTIQDIRSMATSIEKSQNVSNVIIIFFKRWR